MPIGSFCEPDSDPGARLSRMSKAFLPEDTGAASAPLVPPRAARTVAITPAGHRRLHEERRTADPARAAALDRILATVEVVTPRLIDGAAGFGCTITVEDEAGARRTYTLVGPDEVDAPAGHITAESPVGRALLGRREGDVVELPPRRQEVTVVAVGLAEA
jgi:transcription elongation GreA/GreB family factor